MSASSITRERRRVRAGGNLRPVPRPQFIRWFAQITIDDVPLVGGKNASLGEMYRELTPRGVRVPDGFAITAEAYRHFLRAAGLEETIHELIGEWKPGDLAGLSSCGRRIRHAVLAAELPGDLQDEILAAYDRLSGRDQPPVDVAVRSSATAEDLPDASFAGQQETYLNVAGNRALIETCKRCFASLFTDRAISYRADKGFDHFKVALSIGVQRMVRSDLAASGVMFTLDTETGFREAVLINAAYGLGENVVQGSVNPDEYCVFKPTLQQGCRPILRKLAGTKEFKLVYDVGGGRMVKNVPVPPGERTKFALTDDEILELARWACLIEVHYSTKRGQPSPMDIEWAKDGRTGELFIVQARPETVQSRKAANVFESYRLKERGRVLVSGRSVGEKIATGPVRVIRNVQFIHQFKAGEVLVTDKTDPDWEPIMKRAAAIVTNRGGRTCHAAIVSRELGVPALVGTEHGTEVLCDGQLVTVSCAEGDTGYVFEGPLPFTVERTDASQLERPRTKVMMNVASPEEAFALSFIPNEGVGLAREEFIISNYIKVHPLALLACGARVSREDDHGSPSPRPTRLSGSAELTVEASSQASPPKEEREKTAVRALESRTSVPGPTPDTVLPLPGGDGRGEGIAAFPQLDASTLARIDELTRGYTDKPQFFVDKLAEGVAMIAAAFYPKDVILRLSDFKTNEYANLIGGRAFEPLEENPMIGFRGASRYYHPRYQAGFALECRAVKKVREEMGLTNLKVMIPFCRTVGEGKRVQEEMAKHGLQRGRNGLEVYVMCEIPSNVILAEEFADIFDGFSIGSNDLTQLILGVDRDSEIVAPIFDERNAAVKAMIAQVIQVCRRRKRKIGICGQAPSDYPEFAQFLVEQGIDSISLNPDTVIKTTAAILERERELKRKQR